MPLALCALAVGAFGIGVTEFVIMGLLLEVAVDLQVSIPSAIPLIAAIAPLAAGRGRLLNPTASLTT